MAIWTESGHLAERGNRAYQYCMSRIGDQGAYEVGNVFIQTNAKNLSQPNVRAKIHAAKDENGKSIAGTKAGFTRHAEKDENGKSVVAMKGVQKAWETRRRNRGKM